MKLCDHLKIRDLKAFNFHDFVEFDLILYFQCAVHGGRKYLLGEKDENLDKDRKKYEKMAILDFIVKTVVVLAVFWTVFVKYDVLGLSKMYCNMI
jgi:hypothetical protein